LERYRPLIDRIKGKHKNQSKYFLASSAFEQAKFLICRQRLLSMNNRKIRTKRGLRKGFTDFSFHMGFVRGYTSIVPQKLNFSSELSKFGPFFKGSHLCEFLGTSSLSYWKGRSVILPFSICNSIAWYLDLIPKEVKKTLGNIENAFVALPSYVASFSTLRNFSCFRKGYRGKIKSKLLNIEGEVHRLKLPIKIPAPVREDVFNAKLTEGTHPGIVTRTQTYLKNKSLVKNSLQIKKRDIIRKAVRDVLNNWNRIGEGKFKNTAGTYMLGSREKIQVLNVGEFVKLRTVWIPETIDILIGSTWFEHLKEYWSKRKLFTSEIWLGHADQHLRFHRRTELDLRFKYSYDFDGKEWETGVVSELIVYAFNIIRSSFVGGKFIDNHFKFIMDTMVNKRIILHNGNTFFCNHGIPSGHAWTSLINSIVNWIIWTSTIKNCPYIPLELKQDYELQIQGDDVNFHCNFPIPEENINKIIEWMLFNFNYTAKFGGRTANKEKDPTGLTHSIFLKRVINSFGLLDTPVNDIWEKILLGPEYSGFRSNRMVYLRRRLNDLAIFNNENKERLALYYAFIKFYPIVGSRTERELFTLLFSITNGFTTSLADRWDKFSKVFNISAESLLITRDYYMEYFSQLYEKNFLTFDDSRPYVDYWKDRPMSVSVREILQNSESLPLSYVKDGFKTLHKVKRRNSPERKDKIMRGIRRLISA
jgi:hypothetical protein